MPEDVTPPVTPPATPATPPATPADAGPWYATLPEELKGYAEHKNFKDVASVVESYKNLEKHTGGVPAERLLRIPDKLDDDKALAPIFAKLGRPEKPDGYAMKFAEGTSEDFTKWAQDTFHGIGLTKRQGEVLAAKWNERVTAFQTQADTQNAGENAQQVEKLKQEWGAAFEQNSAQVVQLAEAMGMSKEQVDAMAGVLGVDGMNKMLHSFITKFGVQLGEPGTRGTDGGGGNSFNVLTPAGAKARIEALKADPDFRERYLNGDSNAKAEMDRLHHWLLPASK